jgi:hypothetical protein
MNLQICLQVQAYKLGAGSIALSEACMRLYMYYICSTSVITAEGIRGSDAIVENFSKKVPASRQVQ